LSEAVKVLPCSDVTGVNYSELESLAQAFGCLVEADNEDSPSAPCHAAIYIKALRAAGVLNGGLTLCTLGRSGVVLSTSQGDIWLRLSVRPGTEVATRSGAGDKFFGLLALYLYLNGRASVRDTTVVLGATVRAMHHVVRWLGQKARDYRVIPRALPVS